MMRGTMPRRTHSILFITAVYAVSLASACSEFVKPELPGQTEYQVDKVEWKGATLDHAVLDQNLSVRADSLIIPGQPYNPYRLAEDRRRIAAWWKNFGYFDVTVAKADVKFDEKEKTVAVTWTVDEGQRYALKSIEVRGAPDDATQKALVEKVGFEVGAPLDVQSMRVRRHELADVLRNDGFMRAEVYSRTFVDRSQKSVDWFFYADPGVKSVIGSITVEGAKKVPEDLVLERFGLKVGDALELDDVRKRELDLADMGAHTIARIETRTGTEFETGAVPWETWIPPDTGGTIAASQVDEQGNLVPRPATREVDVVVRLRESPTTQGKLTLGVNADFERIDPYFGWETWWRNALGPLNHLSFDAKVGYGIRWRGDIDEPLGLHGSGRIMFTRPGLIGRLGDYRIVGEFDEDLYPGFHWRTAAGGMGVRTLIDKGLFFDIEPRFRWDDEVGIGTIDPAVREALHLGPAGDTMAGEARVSLVWDARNDGVEALAGHMIAIRGSVAPVGDATWLYGQLDLRYIIGLNQNMGIALRAAGSWVGELGDNGVPIGARLFGGGAWGMRGFATKSLSLYAPACGGAVNNGEDNATDCRHLAVGAASLFEGSAEFRWLPYRKQFGAVVFADFGGVGSKADPFENDVEFAAGLGIRARIWHLPVALDLAYRITDGAAFDDLDHFLAFLRIGEAF